MRILVTGGFVYVGSVLIPKLIKVGHSIINVDTECFGNYLQKNKKLKNIKSDIANIQNLNINKVDSSIHLASIVNDPVVILKAGVYDQEIKKIF